MALVVEGSRLERNGIGDIARDNDEIGLFRAYHRRNGVERHGILFDAHPAAADVNVGELKHLEALVGIDVPEPAAHIFIFEVAAHRGEGFYLFAVGGKTHSRNAGCNSRKSDYNDKDNRQNLFYNLAAVLLRFFFFIFLAHDLSLEAEVNFRLHFLPYRFF